MKDVPIGSLLIQSDAQTGEPLLLHSSLPHCIRDRKLAEEAWVFLLDAQVRTFRRSLLNVLTHAIYGYVGRLEPQLPLSWLFECY